MRTKTARSVSRTWGIIVWINKEIQECLWQDNWVYTKYYSFEVRKKNSVQKITAREKRINQVSMTSEKNYWVRVWTHNNMHLRSRTEWNKNYKIFIIHCVMCTYFYDKIIPRSKLRDKPTNFSSDIKFFTIAMSLKSLVNSINMQSVIYK